MRDFRSAWMLDWNLMTTFASRVGPRKVWVRLEIRRTRRASTVAKGADAFKRPAPADLAGLDLSLPERLNSPLSTASTREAIAKNRTESHSKAIDKLGRLTGAFHPYRFMNPLIPALLVLVCVGVEAKSQGLLIVKDNGWDKETAAKPLEYKTAARFSTVYNIVTTSGQSQRVFSSLVVQDIVYSDISCRACSFHKPTLIVSPRSC
jgi:hypothetical protein